MKITLNDGKKDYTIMISKNQRAIQINRAGVSNDINFVANAKARKELTANAYLLYMHLLCRNENRIWAVSSQEIFENTSLTHNTYYNAWNELVEKGYIMTGTLNIDNTEIPLSILNESPDRPETIEVTSLFGVQEEIAVEETPKSTKGRISKKDQLLEYINSMQFTEETKEALRKWVFAIGLNKGVTVDQLRDMLSNVWESAHKDETIVRDAINQSYLNQWFGFYVKNNKSRPTTTPLKVTPQEPPKEEKTTREEYRVCTKMSDISF